MFEVGDSNEPTALSNWGGVMFEVEDSNEPPALSNIYIYIHNFF